MITDWRDEPAAIVTPLIAQECEAWEATLGWQVATEWSVLEPARLQRWIPGWVDRDATSGLVRGWAFAVDRAGVAGQERLVGALVTDTPDTTIHLIDAVMAPPCPEQVHVFIRTDTADAPGHWRSSGFDVQSFHYLVKHIEGDCDGPALTHAWTPWTSALVPEAARLLQRAYAEETTVRPFAPGGHANEWSEYLEGLTARPGCGTLIPEASGVLRENDAMVALALTTRIGPDMVHLAQLAVDPGTQRRGVACAMVTHAIRQAQAVTGAREVSLLVSSANTAGLGLYDRLGFQPRGEFLAARLTRVCS